MNIFLRVDASLSIGTGHVIRCLNLAKYLKGLGEHCFFISKNHNVNLIPRIQQEGFAVSVIANEINTNEYINDEKCWLGGTQEDDAYEFIKHVKLIGYEPDIIVIDHYSLDVEWEKIVRSHFPSTQLVVIDDLCNRLHVSDFIIDQTYQRDTSEYVKFNKANAVILAGSQYALLDPKFSYLRKESVARKSLVLSPKKLIITMGGVDAHNVTGRVLTYLESIDYDELENITVILGMASPHSEAIYSIANNSRFNVDVLQNVDNMPELMMENDIAIGALGGTTWERCAMGLPAINIVIADNQKTIAHNLSQAGLSVLFSDMFSEQEFSSLFNEIVKNYHKQREIAMNICDGQGLSRIAQQILPIKSKEGKNVILRLADENDINYVYDLQCEPHTRRFARNPSIPTLQEHVMWMQKKLNEKSAYFYIIETDTRCGVLRLDPIEHTVAQVEISIFLAEKCLGQGIASAAIKRALQLHKGTNILATILPENHASHLLFDRLGFTKKLSDEYVSENKS